MGHLGNFWDCPSYPIGTMGQDRQHQYAMARDMCDVPGIVPPVLMGQWDRTVYDMDTWEVPRIVPLILMGQWDRTDIV